MFAALSEDTVQARHYSGKPLRMLRSKMSDARVEPSAPPVLGMPLQHILMAEARIRIKRAGAGGKAYASPIVGQIVGMMKQETNARRVVQDMVVEFADSIQRLMNTLD